MVSTETRAARRQQRRERRAGAQLSLTLGSWAAVLAALVPLLGVIAPGAWTAGAAGVSAAVFAAGFVGRWYRLSAVTVALIEAAVWVGLVTAMFLSATAIVFVIPTLRALRLVPDLVQQALTEIETGIAPLQADAALSFCIVAGAGLVAIVVDHVAITARMPLAAAVALVAVSLIPSLAVSGPFDVLGFVLLAAAILFLLRAETRTRYRPPRAAPTAPGSTSAIAVSIGLVAMLVAVAATPLLPEPAPRAGAGLGGGTTINASLDLGRDLRRPDPVTVLTLHTTAPSAPYLRVATLSQLDGAVWKPDAFGSTALSADRGFGPLQAGTDIASRKVTTRIRIDALTARYLPVPYPAVSVTGAPSGWEAMDANRTVVAKGVTSSSGQEYTVVSQEPEPTLEQIEAAVARGTDPRDTALSGEVPAVIREDAARITAGTETDYDALIALQSWFRGPEFEYSLTAPAQNGFDGSGISSVAAFLQQKQGYCIHFASAFAIMARVLGMPSRIVVGYLPGSADTAAVADGKPLEYTVSSAQLHAWPEVFFSGIGWVQFEPTKSLGDATSFLPEAAGGGSQADRPQTPSASPTAKPSPSSVRDPDGLRADDAKTGSSATAGPNLVPWALGAAVVVVLLLLPGLIGALRRRRRTAAARAGDPLAAWAAVRDVAIDLGIPVPLTESARAFGTRLVRDHGAPDAQAAALVTAVESAAYAPGGADAAAAHARDIAEAARAVCAGLYLAVSTGRRMRALLFPRSLIVRPGSAYARAGASAPTR
ncbi:transglutaminaseTgpA domain-containing protein [Microbacterium luticocti]|uniref:transglutaminase family protein n=1 Tax=Microbacterium luticocti TaxID=451764 RepID=UPI0004148F5B|nr:DUF3488 and transglutaminase-like domain-containing protein [Microbacterium luticocti]